MVDFQRCFCVLFCFCLGGSSAALFVWALCTLLTHEESWGTWERVTLKSWGETVDWQQGWTVPEQKWHQNRDAAVSRRHRENNLLRSGDEIQIPQGVEIKVWHNLKSSLFMGVIFIFIQYFQTTCTCHKYIPCWYALETCRMRTVHLAEDMKKWNPELTNIYKEITKEKRVSILIGRMYIAFTESLFTKAG